MSDLQPVLPIAKPVLDEREAEAARRPILSGWVTQGPEVSAFEREFAAYVRAPYACAVSSCTTALHLALLACDVKQGDEVITASHSFIATANAIRHAGAKPVFVDVDPATFNLDVQQIKRAITARTRAILCVHQMGMPCDLGAVVAFAHEHGLRVIEDAACAVGSEIRAHGGWEPIGKPHGDVACFSFHPRKVITTGDGGMLTTAHAEWDQRFRLWRQHGMSVSDTVRHGSPKVVFEEYPVLGYNYRLTDIQAAIGREQLRRLPEILERRRALTAEYHRLLAAVPGVVTPYEPPWAKSNWQSYCVRLPVGVDQRSVMQKLLDSGISTRRGIMCIHREAAYPPEAWSCPGKFQVACGCAPGHCVELRASEEAQDQCVLLPLYPQMRPEDQQRVVAQLAASLRS